MRSKRKTIFLSLGIISCPIIVFLSYSFVGGSFIQGIGLTIMEFALIFCAILIDILINKRNTEIKGNEKTPEIIIKLLETNDLDNFMKKFNESYINNDFMNLEDTIRGKIEKKIYSIWDLNPLKVVHLEKLGIFFLQIENIFGDSSLLSIATNIREKMRNIMLDKGATTFVIDFIILISLSKVDFLKLYFSEVEIEDILKNMNKITDREKKIDSLFTINPGLIKLYYKIDKEKLVLNQIKEIVEKYNYKNDINNA